MIVTKDERDLRGQKGHLVEFHCDECHHNTYSRQLIVNRVLDGEWLCFWKCGNCGAEYRFKMIGEKK